MSPTERVQKWIDTAGGAVLIAVQWIAENGDLTPVSPEDAVCPAIVADHGKIAFYTAGEGSDGHGHVLDVVDSEPDPDLGESLIVEAKADPAGRYRIVLSWIWNADQWEAVNAEESKRPLEARRAALREEIDAVVSFE